jgi:hypothetical protein
MLHDPRFDPMAPADLQCPDCRRPAQIIERFTFAGAPAAVEHVKVICARGHWFTLPLDMLAAYREPQAATVRQRRPARRRQPEIAHTRSGSRASREARSARAAPGAT